MFTQAVIAIAACSMDTAYLCHVKLRQFNFVN